MARLVLFSWVIALGICASSQPAHANDTEAALGIGGLVWKTNNDIELVSEDLFVSSGEIRVSYVFRNHADRDIATLIAFPLPEIKYDADNNNSVLQDMEFSTVVNGEAVQSKVEEKAVVGDEDHIATLDSHGLPPDPNFAFDVTSAKTEAEKARLREQGLIDSDNVPTWTLKKSYYWEQLFPANAEVRISHRYKPIVGGTVVTNVDGWATEGREFYGRYCVDEQFVEDVRQSAKGESTQDAYSETWIDYVLTTGANWKGPIRDFRLTVDKERGENLVSFCGEGVRKIGPTTFEMTATNFVPKADLQVLILVPRPVAPAASEGDDMSALSCEDLWYRRNSVFKAKGYCFKSSRAISKFGNAGCAFDDAAAVPLSTQDRELVGRITSIEQEKRCSD